MRVSDQTSLGAWYRFIGLVEHRIWAIYYGLGDIFVFASKSEPKHGHTPKP